MFEFINASRFADEIQDVFGVLDKRYVADLCQELIPRLQATFDGAFETRYVIGDTATRKPVSKYAILDERTSAEELCRLIGDDHLSVGILVTER